MSRHHPHHPAVEYGHADTNWDVFFTPHHVAQIDHDTSLNAFISVYINPENGAVDLNAGYDEGSAIGDLERALFDEYKDLIVEELVAEIAPRAAGERADYYADYLAFLRKANAEAEPRRERLIRLYADLD